MDRPHERKSHRIVDNAIDIYIPTYLTPQKLYRKSKYRKLTWMHWGHVPWFLTSIHKNLVTEFATGHGDVFIVCHLHMFPQAVCQFVLLVTIQAFVEMVFRSVISQGSARIKLSFSTHNTGDCIILKSWKEQDWFCKTFKISHVKGQ